MAIGTVNATVYSPEAQVERYLDALADGDGATALGLAGGGDATEGSGTPGPAPGTATTLLDGEPLAAGFSALEDVTVSRGEESGDEVEVAVGYGVDGQDHATTFTVERVGRDWLFFDRWRMAPVPMSTVRVAPGVWPAEAAGQQLASTVNGVEVTLTGDSSPAQDFAVLPPLAVEGSAASTYLEAAPARTVRGRGRSVATAPPGTWTCSTRMRSAAEANRQLDEYLARCTGQQVLHPAGCPMGYETLNRIPPESIGWSLLIAPDPTVEPSGPPVAAGDGAGGDDGTTGAAVHRRQAEARSGPGLETLEEIDLVTGERRRVDHEQPLVCEADLQVGPESVSYLPRSPRLMNPAVEDNPTPGRQQDQVPRPPDEKSGGGDQLAPRVARDLPQASIPCQSRKSPYWPLASLIMSFSNQLSFAS